MEQCFILKRHSRSGTGRALARHVTPDKKRPWEIGEMPGNTAALAFWRRFTAELTAGAFTARRVSRGWWQGTVQQFHVPIVDT
jgi:predicted acetyltransferase